MTWKKIQDETVRNQDFGPNPEHLTVWENRETEMKVVWGMNLVSGESFVELRDKKGKELTGEIFGKREKGEAHRYAIALMEGRYA